MNCTCRICGTSEGHQTYLFRERMFGWGDAFTYFQCGRCGCMQIVSAPADLARFYPSHYYSFHQEPLPQRGWKSWLAAKRDLAAMTGTGLLGRALGQLVPPRIEVACLGRVPLRTDMRIMDVGCGRGQLLSILHRAGLPYLFGVDPYLPTDVEVVPGVRVLKRHVHEVEDNFDLIMLHHVFEHIEDGLDMLVACRRRLTAGGKILLRMPIVDCWAWERYREYWVALDAPRHLVLHTRASLERLAGQAGLRVAQCCCDSTAFQFFASELYRKGLPLVDGQGQTTRTENHFTPDQMKQFEREAQSLNAANRGDQIVAILQPLDD